MAYPSPCLPSCRYIDICRSIELSSKKEKEKKMRGGSGGEPNGVQQPQQQGQEEEEVEDERMQERGAQRQQRRQQRSSSASQHPQPPRSVGYVGKHRLSAAIARLDQELQSLQDELNELEMMEAASAECKEVITSTEGKPDPLLPVHDLVIFSALVVQRTLPGTGGFSVSVALAVANGGHPKALISLSFIKKTRFRDVQIKYHFHCIHG